MGFAWIAEGGRHGLGRFHFDRDFDDDDEVRGGPGSLGDRPRTQQIGRQPTGPGRHVRPKNQRPILGGVGVAGLYLKARARRPLTAPDQSRPSAARRGAHAAGLPGSPR